MQRFVSNLSLSRKFVAIGAVALAMVALPTALAVRGVHATLAAAQARTTGLAPAADVLTLIRTTQRHRAQAALLLRGDAARHPDLEASRAEVDRALAMVRASIGGVAHGGALAGRVDALQRSWRGLAEAAGAGALAETQSVAQHGAVLADQLALLDAIVDNSTLALDPAAGTHHLIHAVFIHLPRLTVSLGQVPTRGVAQASAEDRLRFAANTDLARLHARHVERALDKAMAADPSVRVALERHVIGAREASAAWFRGADERLAAADAAPAVDAQFGLIEAAFRTLDPVLRDRVARERRWLWTLVGGLAVLGTLGAWLIALTARAMSRHTVDAFEPTQRSSDDFGAADSQPWVWRSGAGAGLPQPRAVARDLRVHL